MMRFAARSILLCLLALPTLAHAGVLCSNIFDPETTKHESTRALLADFSKKPETRRASLVSLFEFLVGHPFDAKDLELQGEVYLTAKVHDGKTVTTVFTDGRKTSTEEKRVDPFVLPIVFESEDIGATLSSEFRFTMNALEIGAFNKVNGERLAVQTDPEIVKLIDVVRMIGATTMMDPADVFELHTHFDEITVRTLSASKMWIRVASTYDGRTVTDTIDYTFTKNESGALTRLEITDATTPKSGNHKQVQTIYNFANAKAL